MRKAAKTKVVKKRSPFAERDELIARQTEEIKMLRDVVNKSALHSMPVFNADQLAKKELLQEFIAESLMGIGNYAVTLFGPFADVLDDPANVAQHAMSMMAARDSAAAMTAMPKMNGSSQDFDS